jgi:hypothetical protein
MARIARSLYLSFITVITIANVIGRIGFVIHILR